MIIRKILIALLGFERYLRFISFIFIRTYVAGFYLSEHFQVRFLRKLVRSGDCCIDIGANLGYFSVPLSRLLGPKGKLYAVEPVPMFRQVLSSNLKSYGRQNAEVLPYALGEEDGKEILMTTPTVSGIVRHGRTKVQEPTTESQASFQHQAIMRAPAALFAHLEKLDFIKCDVEGYEMHIMPHFLPLIERFKPIIEIEIDPMEHKQQMMEMLQPLGYKPHYLADGKLCEILPNSPAFTHYFEWYFVPKHRLAEVVG